MTRFDNLIEALNAAPPDRPFVTAWVHEEANETVTFAEFRRRARIQAGILLSQHIASGDRIVIIMPQGIPAMAVFVGAMMVGAVPTFLAYPNLKVEPSKYRSGLAGVSANLTARLVVIDAEFPDEMLSHVFLNEETRLVRVGDDTGSGERVDQRTDLRIDEGLHEKHLPELMNRSDKVAFIQHSAGTTGLQKGVALTHAAVLKQIGHLARALEIDGATDRIYSWLPLYHDMGLIACFMLPMVCHTAVVMQSPLDWVMHPATMLQLIDEYRCSLAWLPNFAFQFVSRRQRAEQHDLSSIRALINCSEPVRASSMREFHDAFATMGLKSGALQTSYAMAENVFAVSQSDISSGPARVWVDGAQFRSAHRVVPVAEGTSNSICFVSSGQLLPNHEVLIASDSGAALASDHVGEILIKSDCLFAGYYNRPDLTDSVIVDGWYRTGDLGFYFEGELYVVGRKKDIIIVGGENIYPQDIEELVAIHPAIHDGRVIAMGIYNPDAGTEEIVLVAEVEGQATLANAEKIERQLRSQVTAGMGVAVGTIFLKPPKWIVKSTAGKAARSATLEKLRQEHPELNVDS